jgi:thioredoxin 1
MIKATNDGDFSRDVLDNPRPVLVDYWAEWCGPCRQLLPIVEALAVSMADVMDVMKLNIDENPETPSRYGIRGIPTLMLFSKGALIGTKVGMLPPHLLEAWIRETLATPQSQA